MQKIYMETKRLILREHEIDDCETHHELLSDPEDMYYLQDLMTHSMQESRENLMTAIVETYNPKRTMYFLRIEKKETREFIGEIGYTVVAFTPVGKIVHLGYFTKKKFWNQGYVTEAVKAVLEYAFIKNDVIVVRSGCLTENLGSWHVMENCGMIREAEHKWSEWHDGMLKNRYEYRITKEEWILWQKRSKNDTDRGR